MNLTLNRLQNELCSSVHGLDATQTQLRPPASPEKWSVQQIVEHLLMSYAGSEAALSARIEKRASTKAVPSPRQRLGQFTLITLGYFPNGYQAPAMVTPDPSSPAADGEQLARTVSERLNRLDQLCDEAETLFGRSNRCASHRVLGPLSIDQWRRFQLIHGEHHIKQIAAIRRAHGL